MIHLVGNGSKCPRVRVIGSMSFFFLLAILGSCGSGKTLELAAHAVEQFHSQMNSEQYQAIYAASDDGLHKATNEAEFIELLQAIHRKLGNVQTSTRSNSQVGAYTGQGIVVTLVYETTFKEGSGTEQFLWHVRDNQPVLLGYHINSKDLITK